MTLPAIELAPSTRRWIQYPAEAAFDELSKAQSWVLGADKIMN